MEVCNGYLLFKRFHTSFFGFEDGLEKGELRSGVPSSIYGLITANLSFLSIPWPPSVSCCAYVLAI
jgi:hypothetical protein